MSKLSDESFIQYKHRVIDRISPSYCAAKFYNSTIWLDHGKTASCHHTPAYSIDVKELEHNPSALHNTPGKKVERRMMLDGERPRGCEYCWKIEDIDRNNVSDRVFKTVIYDDDEILATQTGSTDLDIIPKTLEISFDRTCNLACSYCSANFSTSWSRDLKKHGPYVNLKTDQINDVALQSEDENPYVAAFWRWWPELSKNLKQIRLTGGEPLMSRDMWRLIEEFRKNDNKEINLAINSNLIAKDNIIDRFIHEISDIGAIDLYTSCEAFGEQAEFIRDGFSWDGWVSNCERMMREANLRSFHVMMTITNLSLFSITEFVDTVLDWKKRFGHHAPHMSFNILRHPSFFSPVVLPDDIRKERVQHLRKWYTNIGLRTMLTPFERSGIERLIDYLEVVEEPHAGTASLADRLDDLKTFIHQYENRRGLTVSVFPEGFASWLRCGR